MAKKTTRNRRSNVENQLNETGRRHTVSDRRQRVDSNVVNERRKTPRRRQIDPTTCEREYTESEIEFMHALDDYKRASGRMFPTCSEILEVLYKLGYRKVAVGEHSLVSPQIGVPVTIEATVL